MRKCRVIENCRCYHLISRLAHRTFFPDDAEKTRAVEFLRRVEEFCGVTVLAYAIMTNHFHIYVYVPESEEIDDDDILRRCLRRAGLRERIHSIQSPRSRSTG